MTRYAPGVKHAALALLVALSSLLGPCTDPDRPVPVLVDAPGLV